jgi:hypothetical protein
MNSKRLLLFAAFFGLTGAGAAIHAQTVTDCLAHHPQSFPARLK